MESGVIILGGDLAWRNKEEKDWKMVFYFLLFFYSWWVVEGCGQRSEGACIVARPIVTIVGIVEVRDCP